MSLADLTPEETSIAAILFVLFRAEACRRGNVHNAPYGLFASEFAGGPLARAAWEAATLAREAADADP